MQINKRSVLLVVPKTFYKSIMNSSYTNNYGNQTLISIYKML